MYNLVLVLEAYTNNVHLFILSLIFHHDDNNDNRKNTFSLRTEVAVEVVSSGGGSSSIGGEWGGDEMAMAEKVWSIPWLRYNRKKNIIATQKTNREWMK